MKYVFPKNFYWGASTSAHQVEGGLTNDWSEWEKGIADKLASQPEVWQRSGWRVEQFPEMKNPANYISGKACDHYNKYREDFKLAKELGHNATRFSVDWSRIEPEEGKFDEKELEHYLEEVKYLRSLGIESFVTLWHWPLPLWLRDKGGWENKETIKYFEKFSEKVVTKLKGEVKYWITLNEPEVYMGQSYFLGDWPPQKKSVISAWVVIHNLIEAHRKVYGVIKKIDSKLQVGIAKNNIYHEAYQGKWWNKVLKTVYDWRDNKYILDKISDCQDFIGLNHYLHDRIDGWTGKNEDKCVSDFGWEIYPESIYHALIELKKYNKPVFITEHGCADAKDEYRPWFLVESLKSLNRAIEDGVDVRGYLYWSLMDNFEWDKGFWLRFGLIEINYENLERKPRKSAYLYQKIIEKNGIDEAIEKMIKKPY